MASAYDIYKSSGDPDAAASQYMIDNQAWLAANPSIAPKLQFMLSQHPELYNMSPQDIVSKYPNFGLSYDQWGSSNPTQIGATPAPTTAPTLDQMQGPTVSMQPLQGIVSAQQGQDGSQLTSLPIGNYQPNVPSGTGFVLNGGGVDHGITVGNVANDTSQILQNARNQQAQGLATLNIQDTRNKSFLSDMSKLLQEQQAAQLSDKVPGIYEDLNSRGLLHSSAVGNSLAIEQAKMARDTSNQLAQQGLEFNKQYTQGIGNIQSNFSGQQNQALSRAFNLEDYNNQLRASQLLGYALQPQQQNTGKSAGEGAAQGAAIQTIGTMAGK